MISLQQIQFYLPKKKLIIKNKYKSVNNSFLKNKIGAFSLPRCSNSNTVVEMCLNVVKKINLKKYKKKLKQ